MSVMLHFHPGKAMSYSQAPARFFASASFVWPCSDCNMNRRYSSSESNAPARHASAPPSAVVRFFTA